MLSFNVYKTTITSLACLYLSKVDLIRSFSFRNSKGTYRGIPIIAANMDTVGNFEMALALHKVAYNKQFITEQREYDKIAII